MNCFVLLVLLIGFHSSFIRSAEAVKEVSQPKETCQFLHLFPFEVKQKLIPFLFTNVERGKDGFLFTSIKTEKDFQEALKTFNACGDLLVNDEDTSRAFINFLHDLFFENGMSLSTDCIKSVSAFFFKGQEEQWKEDKKIDAKKGHLIEWDEAFTVRDELKSLIESCAKTGEWYPFKESFEKLEKNCFCRALLNSLWDEKYVLYCISEYCSYPAKKNLLVRLVEANAPAYILSLCINAGASTKLSHSSPPLLLVCYQELIKHAKENAKKNQQEIEDIDLKALLDGNTKLVAQFPGFKERLEALKNANAPINDFFYAQLGERSAAPLSPLVIVAQEHYTKMLQELIEGQRAVFNTSFALVYPLHAIFHGKKNFNRIIPLLAKACPKKEGKPDKTELENAFSYFVRFVSLIIANSKSVEMLQKHGFKKEDLRNYLLLFYAEADISGTYINPVATTSALLLAEENKDAELVNLISQKKGLSLDTKDFKEIIEFDGFSVEQIKALFERAKDCLVKKTTTVAVLTPILQQALLCPSLEESKQLLKCASTCQPFVFQSMDPNIICKENASIFHFIVYTAYSCLKHRGKTVYSTCLREIVKANLIGWLSSEGVTDTVMGDEKISAFTLATNLGLGDLEIDTNPEELFSLVDLLKSIPVYSTL